MALACPQCKQIFEKSGVCPLCNVVLLFHAENLQTTPVARVQEEDEPPQWQQTPWGKIVIGLILAQGLRFGCEQLLMAGFLATGDGSDVWHTLWGIVLRHFIHGVSLILGGALAGAGQSRGIIYGALIGLVSGIVALGLKHREILDLSSWLFYAEPIIHLATGALGGALGMLIWRPTPTLPEMDGNTPAPVPVASFATSMGNLFSGQIHAGRVCAGAFVVVVGVVWSKAILEFLLRASSGSLTITSTLQAQLVCMEITALVALIGAAFAGATTRNGLKQGLCVGLGASIIVLGIQIGNPRFNLESVIFTISGVVIVSLIGGWFGSQLFPPVFAKRRRFSTY
jgi:hypothetical protein